MSGVGLTNDATEQNILAGSTQQARSAGLTATQRLNQQRRAAHMMQLQLQSHGLSSLAIPEQQWTARVVPLHFLSPEKVRAPRPRQRTDPR